MAEDRNPIGLHHKKPLFNAHAYTVELTAKYQANIIAENLFSQSDSEGRHFMDVMKEICDHKKDGEPFPSQMDLPRARMGTWFQSRHQLWQATLSGMERWELRLDGPERSLKSPIRSRFSTVFFT